MQDDVSRKHPTNGTMAKVGPSFASGEEATLDAKVRAVTGTVSMFRFFHLGKKCAVARCGRSATERGGEERR